MGMQLKYVTDQGVFSKSGIDFGSRLLVETIQQSIDKLPLVERPGSILDLGCGYGAMGLALAKKNTNCTISMVDINERAVQLCRKNALSFGLANVKVEQSDGFEALSHHVFDWIITNPPIRAGKSLIHTWFEQAAAHLNPTGQLWIVIQKKQGAPSARKKLESLFAFVDEVERDKGYSIFLAKK